jgi:hypothetical protein
VVTPSTSTTTTTPRRSASAPRGRASSAASAAGPSHAAGLPNSARDRIEREREAQREKAKEREEEERGLRIVTGLAVVPGNGRSQQMGLYLLVSLGTGKLVRVDVGAARPSSAGNSGAVVVKDGAVG